MTDPWRITPALSTRSPGNGGLLGSWLHCSLDLKSGPNTNRLPPSNLRKAFADIKSMAIYKLVSLPIWSRLVSMHHLMLELELTVCSLTSLFSCATLDIIKVQCHHQSDNPSKQSSVICMLPNVTAATILCSWRYLIVCSACPTSCSFSWPRNQPCRESHKGAQSSQARPESESEEEQLHCLSVCGHRSECQ